MKRISRILLTAIFTLALAAAVQAATISPNLNRLLGNAGDSVSVGVVIVSFNTNNGLNATHVNVLRGLGINGGLTMKNLGMVAIHATAGQVRQLAANPAVRSVWSNDKLTYYMEEARKVTGVDRVTTDSAFTVRNGGLPVSGKGDFSVMIIDSGIDATHADLPLGTKVVQNVQVLTSSDLIDDSTYVPLVVAENVPNTDQSVGHGTHCAGIVGGLGTRSGGKYAGVAPGSKLIGAGLGAGLFVLNAVGAWEWTITNQFRYNIRVVSNSYGSNGEFNPDNPINIASKTANDRNMVILFAGGNSGPGKNTYNPYAKAPWVIGVAAGTKEGGLASFSSRGTPRSQRLTNESTLDDYDAPTITAPGTGREFETNAGKFTAAMVSTRSTSNIVANGGADDTELSPAMLPFYTQISGTSMATPFVAGVVALMLDADPTLTPAQIRDILVRTATPMPGYEDYEAGAGYVNAYAAVDKVFNRSKNYGSYLNPTFNAQYSVRDMGSEQFHIDYDPTSTPSPTSPNSKSFAVAEGVSVLDIMATFTDTADLTGGNTIGMIATAPDGTKYSSGIALAILDASTREIMVKSPQPGNWLLEIRGVRGLATAPGVSLPTTGAALPGPVDGTILQQRFDLAFIADIQGHVAQAQIESALKNRQMDTFSDGTFRPDMLVTRGDLASLLAINTPLRQSVGAGQKYFDLTAEQDLLAQAVTANGSTLRDYTFTPTGMINPNSGAGFKADTTVSRTDVAVALVKALGFDAEAKAKAGQPVTVVYQGQTLTLTDNADIPSALRGYVQYALDRGILQAYFTLEQGPFDFQPTLKARVKPGDFMSRALMAYALDHYRQHFVAGN